MNRETGRRVVLAYMHGLEGAPPVLSHTQREIVRDIMASRRTAILGARQVVRKTTAIAYVASCLALGYDPETGADLDPDTVQIVSKTEKHAQEVVNRAQKIIKGAFNVGVQRHTRDDSMLDEKLGSLSRIRTALGTDIVAHAGNPNALQGFSGHVIVDEISANRNDPAEIFPNALAATFGRHGRLFVMIGNASFVEDWWYNFWFGTTAGDVKRRAVFSLTKHTIHDVFGPVLPPEWVEDCDAMGGPDSADWRRWMLCEFVQGAARVLSDAEIAALSLARVNHDRRARIVVGFDPGGHPNPSGIVVARIGLSGVEVLHSEYWRGPRISGDPDKRAAWSATQVARVREVVKQWKARAMYVDHSNLAPEVGTALADIFGDMCTLCRTTTDLRQARWGVLRAFIGDGVCAIPESHTDLLDDLRAACIDKDVKGGGKRREGGVLVLPQTPDDGHILHCDVLDGLLLCCEALIQPED